MQNEPNPAAVIYDIAHAVHKHITALPSPIRHLYLQPLNVQIPRRTSWWLVPSPQMPIYRYSKLFFHQISVYSPDVIAGFSFERGLGGQLSGLVDSALLMQTDWYWRRFLNDVMAGELAKPINTIEKRSNAKQKLIIELYNFNRLHRRLLETKIPDDILVFELEHGPNALATENAGTQQLQTLNDIDRCYDLVINIEMNPDFAWYWMRFTFGVPLSAVYFDTGNGNIANLWDDILSPWMPLVG